MSIQLRPYQEDAVAAVYPLDAGQRKLICIPTGGGKSLIAARLASDAALFGRVLIITHVRELVEQNEEDLRKLSPELDIGVYCSGLERYDTTKTITIAAIQSIYKRLLDWIDVDLIIVDEAHRISPQGGKMYRAVLDAFKHIPIVGLTATPFRMGTGYLHKGEHAIFHELSYEVPYDQLVAEGWLAPFAEKGSELAYDTSKVHIKAGEFAQGEIPTFLNVGNCAIQLE